MRPRLPWLAAVLGATVALASSCGYESGGGGQQMSYKEVKSMVIDILGSQEAQEAINKASTAQYGASSLHMQSMSPQDQQQVRLAVKDVLTSPDYSYVLQGIMKDPKFAGEFAKAVSKDNKQIHKDLLKDPSYQKDLVTVLKQPEMQKVMFEAMKTPEFRIQMMSAVQESMQSPLFRMEVLKLLQSAVKEELNPLAKKGQGQQGQGEGGQQGNKSAGDDGGGGGGGDSGGGGGMGGS